MSLALWQARYETWFEKTGFMMMAHTILRIYVGSG